MLYSEQIPLIEGIIERLPQVPAAPPKEVYLVAAWNVAGYWKIHRETASEEFATQDAARDYAAGLNAQWIYRTIIRVPLRMP
jgi:hypothetical protein